MNGPGRGLGRAPRPSAARVAALRRRRSAARRLRAPGGSRGPAPRRRAADGRRPPRRRLAPQRRASAARARRPAADAAAVRAAPVHARRAGRARLARPKPTPSCSTRCVRARLSIVISGGTSSGKTSLLGALAARIDAAERIVTVEDAAELRIDRPHVARLEARGASLEGSGEVGIRELVRNALRMRPDRLVVGEVRGGEALDMLQAMTTGHDGSLTTVHAKSPGRRAQAHRAPGADGRARAAARRRARAGRVGLRRRRAGGAPRATASAGWSRSTASERRGRGWQLGSARGRRAPLRASAAGVSARAARAASPRSLCLASVAGAERAPARAPAARPRRARGERALERELPDALRRVAAELGAGRTADRALVAAAAGGRRGRRGVRARRAARSGAARTSPRRSAAALGQRARFAAAAISLQLRAGGDLPALLRSLARRLDERRGVNAEIRALTAQARLSARVVPLLPGRRPGARRVARRRRRAPAADDGARPRDRRRRRACSTSPACSRSARSRGASAERRARRAGRRRGARGAAAARRARARRSRSSRPAL